MIFGAAVVDWPSSVHPLDHRGGATARRAIPSEVDRIADRWRGHSL